MQTSIARQCTSKYLHLQTAHFHHCGIQLQFCPFELLLGRYEYYKASYLSNNYFVHTEMMHN